MKRLREVLRLKQTAGLANRAIGRAVNISPGTVSYYVRAAQAAGLDWVTIETLSDDVLIQTLTPYCRQRKPAVTGKQEPDYTLIHQELKKKGVTLQLLHEEYQERYGKKQSYSYSIFCQHFRRWLTQQKPSLRMIHHAGEKAFVDYAGPTIAIHNASTGEVHQAKIFIGVLGASNFTYAEATLTRSIPDWIGAHIRMLHYFGGVPTLIIPDNEKAGVKQACYYDPELNPNYSAFAAHYNLSVLPTRPRKPKDKAKVENAVQVVERWIMATLRHYQFFSLGELNQAISQLLVELNNRPFKKLPGTRSSQFEALDKPALNALPKTDYQIASFQRGSVRLDYHVEVEKHYYSVPYLMIGATVDVRISGQLVEIYHQNKRIATHLYSAEIGKSTTELRHMPAAHQAHQQWTPLQFKEWGISIGESTATVCEKIIHYQSHPECCQRIHSGLKNLAKRHGDVLLEKACHYALLTIAVPSFHSIKSILNTKIYQQLPTAKNDEKSNALCIHENIRGENYYQQTMKTEGE